MMGRLFVGVGELDHVAIIVRPSQENDSSRQTIARKTRGNDNRWNEDEKSIQMRRALVVDIRRTQSLADARRLVLHCFVNDRVEPVVGHHLQQISHQLIARLQALVVSIRI